MRGPAPKTADGGHFLARGRGRGMWKRHVHPRGPMPRIVTVATPLPRAFYARDAVTVARALLGTLLVFRTLDGTVARARVVETEAYVGAHDLACHAARGRTARTEVMFGPAGHAYVYFIYGMYDMLNVVTGPTGDAQAVLIRAAEGITGVTGALNGPGRLTRALGITRGLNGADLCAGPLTFEAGEPPAHIVAAPRVGVGYAGPWAEAPLRFYDAASRQISRR
jgi:DNA-3-methyladenine glycosylase